MLLFVDNLNWYNCLLLQLKNIYILANIYILFKVIFKVVYMKKKNTKISNGEVALYVMVTNFVSLVILRISFLNY